MKDILEKLVEIRESQIRMEDDLKYHIKRTDLLEEKIDNELEEINKELQPVHKAYIGLKWSLGALILLGSAIGAIARIKGIL